MPGQYSDGGYEAGKSGGGTEIAAPVAQQVCLIGDKPLLLAGMTFTDDLIITDGRTRRLLGKQGRGGHHREGVESNNH